MDSRPRSFAPLLLVLVGALAAWQLWRHFNNDDDFAQLASEFAEFMRKDVAHWGTLIKESGAKVE